MPKLFIVIPSLVVLGIIGFYSYRQYKGSEIEQTGITVCDPSGTCEKSLHIHSTLAVEICGKAQGLDKDTGELADIHTHKEDNLLHFHERLKVNKAGEVLDWSPLMLSRAVREVADMELTQTCLGAYCNGTKCPSSNVGTLKLEVNGQPQADIPNYVWKDQDDIRLTFE